MWSISIFHAWRSSPLSKQLLIPLFAYPTQMSFLSPSERKFSAKYLKKLLSFASSQLQKTTLSLKWLVLPVGLSPL